jgi:hypothetical protein
MIRPNTYWTGVAAFLVILGTILMIFPWRIPADITMALGVIVLLTDTIGGIRRLCMSVFRKCRSRSGPGAGK